MFSLYSSESFESKFTYSGQDLGAVWSPEHTAFRVWAPTAQEVSVLLYTEGTGEKPARRIQMAQSTQGTWAAEVEGNLNGIYYTYLVLVEGQMRECCDPYARAVGVNGERAMVLDLQSTDPQNWENDTPPHKDLYITDAVIYEAHVRDLTMGRDAPAIHRGQFLGVIESGYTKGGQPTGLRHIQALGVTHVQFLPLFDFGWTDETRKHPQYNWGYDPVNYNAPEGSYSADPFDGSRRVWEMKQMVLSLHQAGLGVIMDVVYNHVYDAEHFCFNEIVPGYFSRWESNGSCCGNDTASERSMVRKFIVDSVNYWADEYHIDGFRFDLVGLLDTRTIQEIMETVHSKHPHVLFYGEGWTMDTRPTKGNVSLTVQGNSGLVPGFAFFNDTIRDTLRGSVFDSSAPGFVSGGYCPWELLESCFLGMPRWASQPDQCVNYVSCHDNHTLFDRIALGAPEAPRETRIRMNCLAAAYSMLSQGVPFLMAGEEILRSKPGRHGGFDQNSYRSGDRVNAIAWEDLDKPDCQEVAQFYRGLIAFRKAHKVLRLHTREEIQRRVSPWYLGNDHCVAFHLDEDSTEILVVFNSDTQDIPLELPEGKWNVNIRNLAAEARTIERVSGTVWVSPVSALVLTRRKPVDVVAALLWEKDKLLICRRPPNKARGLLWEFVGGKVEPGETHEEALIRECREELDVTVEVHEPFMQVLHEYPDMTIRLRLYHCIIPEGFPKMLEHVDLRWVHPRDTGRYEFCPADTEIVEEVKRQYENRQPL